MTYAEISMLVVRESSNIVYLSDPWNYEILFLNRAIQELLGCSDESEWLGQPCYRLLQGLDAPCPFCTNDLLSQDEFYCWEHYNEKLKRYFYKKNKLVELDGRLVRLEIATDNTERELFRRRLERDLDMERTLVSCVQTLSQSKNLELAISRLLGTIGTFYQAARAYIFECDYEKGQFSNTYEWCKPGVKSQMQALQGLPLAAMEQWLERLRREGEFYFSREDGPRDGSPSEYAFLERRALRSVMGAPLLADGRLTGFIGVEDPEQNMEELTLLRSVAYFVMDDLQKWKLNARLKTLSYTDELTGAGNRTKYVEVLRALEAAPSPTLGIIYVDINGMKLANDTYGHQYGDTLIRRAAQVLRAFFPDQVYRVGGDEFVVLCTELSYRGFQEKVEALRSAVQDDKECSLSIGVNWGGDRADVTKQIISADELMYIEKQRYYSAQAPDRGSHRSNLSKELLQEIDAGRFTVYLQPKFQLGAGRICGAEALVRKLDEQGRCQPPIQFIPRYEAEGIIRHVDFFVLRSVCQLLHRWAGQGCGDRLRVAVNLSRLTLMEHGVADELAAVCGERGISPGRIIIEVTESLGRMEIGELRHLMESLRRAGFSVSLDDFGSEYSNLAILTDLEFDEVKLDKSLIDGLERNGRSRVVASHAVGLCRELEGISSVAEGIETRGQLDILRELRCEIGQGYYFDAPLPVPDFERKYLRSGRRSRPRRAADARGKKQKFESGREQS